MFQKNDNLVYFSHIPRTGGRYVCSILKRNSYKYDPFYMHIHENELMLNGQELMHASFNTIKKFDARIKKVSKFTIIRNPVDRFKSACNSNFSMSKYFNGYDDFLKLEDYEYFKHIFDEKKIYVSFNENVIFLKGLKNFPNNWFRCQKDFYDKSFWLWKYENGLDKNFRIFLKNSGLDIDINMDIKKEYVLKNYDDKIKDFYLSEKLKRNIIRYYEEDYDFWSLL